jgi:hypothetical protein
MPKTKRNSPAARRAAWEKIRVAASIYPVDATITRIDWIKLITQESRSTIYRAARELGFEVSTPTLAALPGLDETIAAYLEDGLSLRETAKRSGATYYHVRKVRDELL